MSMNKLALALGIGLTLSLAAPSAQADPMVQQLATPNMSASTFSSLFDPKPDAPAMTSNFQFLGAPVSGVMESQVFQGKAGTAAAGLNAYAYQLGVNSVSDNSGNPVNVQSASWKFNATPLGTNFIDNTKNSYYAYAVTDGQVGNLRLPQAAPGQQILSPASLAWEPNNKVGSLVASYVDPANHVPALNAGGNSATFLVITDKPFSQQFVNIQSANPIDPKSDLTTAYAAVDGTVAPIPVPEPATMLAWAGTAGALAFIRLGRKARPATA